MRSGTRVTPLLTERCEKITLSGKRCKRAAVYNSRCKQHATWRPKR